MYAIDLLIPAHPSPLDNHLRKSLSTQRLAAGKIMVSDRRDQVENGRNQQENGGGDQAAAAYNKTEPLHQAHNAIYGCAHIVCGKAAHKLVELR